MKSASSLIPAFATALLHVALIALVVTGLNSEKKSPEPSKPVPMQLLQAQKRPPEQPQATIVEPRQQQPHRKEQDRYQKAKSHAAPTPVPPPREHITAAAKPPEAPTGAAAPESNASSAPPPPRSNSSSPSAAPAASVRHGASVDPIYLATEIEKWYPRQARRYGDQGTVLLHVSVNAAGRVEKVELRKSSGYPLLDSAAVELAKTLTFQPATLDGKPVPDSFNWPFIFKLHD